MTWLTAWSASGNDYWSPHEREELLERLGQYEDLGLMPWQIRKLMDKHITPEMVKEVLVK